MMNWIVLVGLLVLWSGSEATRYICVCPGDNSTYSYDDTTLAWSTTEASGHTGSTLWGTTDGEDSTDESTGSTDLKTTSTTMKTTTTPPPVCTPPAKSIGIDAYLPEGSFNTSDPICPIGSCVCPFQPPGDQNKLFFGPQLYADTRRSAGPNLKVQCSNMSEICVCTINNQCFTLLGDDLESVDFYAYCSSAQTMQMSQVPSSQSSVTSVPDPFVSYLSEGGCTSYCSCGFCSITTTTTTNTNTITYTYTPVETCRMYAVLRCSQTNSTSGLTYKSGATVINKRCVSQLTANKVLQNLGTSSPYLQVRSVGCGGCPNPIGACGPYKAPYEEPSFSSSYE